METPTHAINWFEISVADFDRAKKFYENILSYTMPEMPMPGMRMGILPHLREEGIGGAIVHSENHHPSQGGSIVYLNGGNDLSGILNRVESAGGHIMVPKTEIGDGMGYFALFADSEGNTVGLHSMN